LTIVLGQFEWEAREAERNLLIHGISFEQACNVFQDEWAILKFGCEIDGERSHHLIGSAGGVALLVVVHTLQGHHEDKRIRIISARRATPRERRDYRQAISPRQNFE